MEAKLFGTTRTSRANQKELGGRGWRFSRTAGRMRAVLFGGELSENAFERGAEYQRAAAAALDFPRIAR